MSLTLLGVGEASSWRPSDISGMVFWQNPSNMAKVWKDSAASDPATVVGTDTLGAITDNIGGGAFFTQTVAADEPKLVAWSSSRNGALFVDSTDYLNGNASVLSAYNNVAGWTTAFVCELPPVLGTIFQITKAITNAGNTKKVIFVDAASKFGIGTRRVNADTTDNKAGTVSAVAGTRYVVVARVSYPGNAVNGLVDIFVNGSNTGLGLSGTTGWASGATCEALNSQSHRVSNAADTQPMTGGTVAEHLAYNRYLTNAEVDLVTKYLNGNHGVY